MHPPDGSTIVVPRDPPPAWLPAWGEKPPGTTELRRIDAGDWLVQRGRSIVGVAVVPGGTLTRGAVLMMPDLVTFPLSGGELGRPTVTVLLTLDNGDTFEMVGVQPVRASGLPAVSSGGGGVQTGAPSGQYVSATAGAALSGHRALAIDSTGRMVPADPSDAAGYAFAGISTAAAALGDLVQVATAGDSLTEPSWAWTPGAPLYVGTAGALTMAPPDTGVLHQVAVAIGLTTILVQPQTPITRH